MLAAEAVGWSRRPLHRTDLGAGWGRRKRWEYWAVLGEQAMFAVTWRVERMPGMTVLTAGWLSVKRRASSGKVGASALNKVFSC